MEYSALIVAAGQGRRMNLGYNKVFYTFADGKNVLEKTMSIFEADPRCRQIVIVTQREDYVRCMRNAAGKCGFRGRRSDPAGECVQRPDGGE